MKLAATAFLTIALPSSAALAWAPPVQSGPGPQAATVDGGSAAASASRSNANSSATTSATQSSTNTNSVTVVQQATRNLHQRSHNHNRNNSGSSSSGDTRVPVASAIAPSSQYTANPCGGSATSIAGQGPMFGLSFGTGGGFDNSCRLGAIGRQDVAFAYLCEVNGDIRKAARLTARPCPQDQTQPVVHPVVHHPVIRSVPEWCYTASGIELVNHPECR